MKKTILMALLVLSTTTAHSQSVDDLFSKKAVDYLKSVPFDVNRTSLYSAAELYAGYDPKNEETLRPVTIRRCISTSSPTANRLRM